MELGTFAFDMGDHDLASRALRSVTLMKIAPAASAEGTTKPQRAAAYYQLGRIAEATGDRRKARSMLEKALSDDPAHDEARNLLETLR
jgi:tetratricopeptide (TPR) repeat protein